MKPNFQRLIKVLLCAVSLSFLIGPRELWGQKSYISWNKDSIRLDEELSMSFSYREVIDSFQQYFPAIPGFVKVNYTRSRSNSSAEGWRYMAIYQPVDTGIYELAAQDLEPWLGIRSSQLVVYGPTWEELYTRDSIKIKFESSWERDTVFAGEQTKWMVNLIAIQGDFSTLSLDKAVIYNQLEAFQPQAFWGIEPSEIAYPSYVREADEVLLFERYFFPMRERILAFDSIPLVINMPWRLKDASNYQRQTGKDRRSRPETFWLKIPEVSIQSLPETGLPRAFIVGRFKTSITLNEGELRTGDTYELSVEAEGRGNMQFAPAPIISWPQEFLLENSESSYEVLASNQSLIGKKTWKYRFIPVKRGKYIIGPLRWYYFRPELEDYDTIQLLSKEIQVMGADRSALLKRTNAPVFYSSQVLEAPHDRIRKFRGMSYLVIISVILTVCIILLGIYKHRDIFTNSKE